MGQKPGKGKTKNLHTMSEILTNDIYGKALKSYHTAPGNQEIIVHSDIAETEAYPVSWFFRDAASFPELEQKALDLVKGKVLDIGAGTGIHSLELQRAGIDVTAIDVSEGAVEIMQELGVKNAVLQDFYTVENTQYDTLLMLMNGFGIMGTVEAIPAFFEKANELLSPGGQLLVDSSDLLHLYQEEDGSVYINLNGAYYGEVTYQMEFEGAKGHPFAWLFVDFDTLQVAAQESGFRAVKIFEDSTQHYLAQLTRI